MTSLPLGDVTLSVIAFQGHGVTDETSNSSFETSKIIDDPYFESAKRFENMIGMLW